MPVEQWAPMTFDEASMERSKGFVRALQELKNLRPQLYSAAEYCEKSYLHNEQKQMVLDNLKDYAVRALVNAVDHLGTVAYKLTDLYEQQSADVSNVEIRISCLNHQMLMCQSYVDKEGLRQQQLLATTPRHHKHYILPDSINQKVWTGQQLHDGAGQSKITSNLRPNSQGTPATKSLSWHLASESYSGPMKTTNTVSINGSSKSYKTAPEDFHLLDAVEPKPPLPLSSQLQSRGATSPRAASNSTIYKDFLEVPKSLPELKPFEKPTGREICRPVARNKSIISAFFAKNKYQKHKKAYV